MIAIAFAYYNYKFSEFKFVNFNEWVFYTQNSVFEPSEENYLVIFFNSNQKNIVKTIQNANSKYKILAIDYYSKPIESTKNVQFLRAGTNSMLKFIQRFNIYGTPTIFIIKKTKDKLYKQDSMIRKLDNIKQILSLSK
ncbi:MAG: hypothetical protein U9N42_00655 [Campylobacterota bacterium]|nr:hypothetical protein [Campylobacterota bacterium]